MVKNNCGQVHAVCQTVLPGYEDMLIPTEVDSSAILAVPGTDYWAETASHFVSILPSKVKHKLLTKLTSTIIIQV